MVRAAGLLHFSQAALAQMLEISPSYLNQIEHDVRPLTVAVLLRITEVFGVDATFFASQDDTRLVAELRDSQSYVLLTGLGRSLFDYQSASVRQHQEDWAPLLRWLYKAR